MEFSRATCAVPPPGRRRSPDTTSGSRFCSSTSVCPPSFSMVSESRFSTISGSDAASIFMEPIHLSSAVAAKKIISEGEEVLGGGGVRVRVLGSDRMRLFFFCVLQNQEAIHSPS